jgi:hypothetical protein
LISSIYIYYALRFYFPYLSLLAQPVNILGYWPGPINIIHMAVYGPGCHPQNSIWTSSSLRSIYYFVGDRPVYKLPFGLKCHEPFVILYSVSHTKYVTLLAFLTTYFDGNFFWKEIFQWYFVGIRCDIETVWCMFHEKHFHCPHEHACLHRFDLHIIIWWPEHVRRVSKIYLHCGHSNMTLSFQYIDIFHTNIF